MHQDGRSAVLSHDVVTYVYMRFIRFTEEEAYAIRLVLIVRNGSELTDAVLNFQSLVYVAIARHVDSHHLLTNLEY